MIRTFRFREMAEELKLSSESVGEVAFATMLEAAVAVQSRQNLEVIGLRFGLSVQAVHEIISEPGRRAALLADAHKILTALIPLERAISPRRAPTQE